MIALPPFVAGQPAARVDESLRQALAACDRARECAVLWFAEVQRRRLYRQLGHASLELYATQGLGFSRNRYWQFKRLADDLDRLPVLREAVAAGEIGWTKAQQVARVATETTQAAWVAKATTTGRRELEQEVRRRGSGGRSRRAPNWRWRRRRSPPPNRRRRSACARPPSNSRGSKPSSRRRTSSGWCPRGRTAWTWCWPDSRLW